MRVAFITLGCKVNQYETQAMEAMLAERGHAVAPLEAGADAYIINTCTVTSTGDKKSRNAVRRARKLGPDAIVAVCGCYSQLCANEVRRLGADLVGGSGDRAGFLDKLETVYNSRQPVDIPDDAMKRRHFELLPPGGIPGRTRALLKIEDGCTNFCTYCIIPFSRGPVRSIRPEDALEQVIRLRSQGYREIVLTGIEISSYGRDLPCPLTPTDLFEKICRAVPDVRIRLGSLEPRVVDEAFCSRLSALPNLCGHFHLSLQSGCDTTLERMGRRYDTERFFRSVCLLREAFPGCALGADLITGFPGETAEEFSSTLDFIAKCDFAAMHIFPYSERAGTKAASFPGRVPLKEREKRAARASALAASMQEAYLKRQVGSVQDVLYESAEGLFSRGHAPNYTVVLAQGNLRGLVAPTLITEVRSGILLGQPKV